eukprot:m51a1_g9914 hypothetical protein (214) ;mRNA; r:133148-134105
MGRQHKARKFMTRMRLVNPKAPGAKLPQDKNRRAETQEERQRRAEEEQLRRAEPELLVRREEKASSALFFKYNMSLGPPYHVLIDTNFLNLSIQNKLEIVKGLSDCLLAKCVPIITDCVMAELEKLGPKFRVALRIARDPRFERLPCTHKGTYADDCLVQRVRAHRCYIVATCDRDLKRRIRKVPGVPILFIANHKYAVERLPDAVGNNTPFH